jgi:hypothetical protein
VTSIDTTALPDKAAFAAANGWQYDASAPAPQVDVPLFARLQDARVTDRFSDPTFEVGTVTGAIRGGEKTFSVGYLAVRLTRPLPQFELEAVRNNAAKGASVPLSIPDGEQMPLVGDLAGSFSLYGPPGHEGDALNIFTPELLALLADKTGDFDVEIVNDVFLVSANHPFDLTDAALWERLDRIRTVATIKDLTSAPGPHSMAAAGPAEVAMAVSLGATAIGTGVGVIAAIIGVVVAIVGVVVALVATFAFS